MTLLIFVILQFDLVCGKLNMAEVIQTIFLSGLLAGSFFFRPMADWYVK